MQLDATTFILEIVNFGVLLWILWRFLYAPVREVIARRQAAIEKSLTEARETRAVAEEMQTRYENRLADWEGEREQRRLALQAEVSAERARRVQALQAELAGERERNQVLEARRQEELMRRSADEAIAQAARFAGRLLTRLAGPELESRIVATFLEDVHRLPEEKRQALRAACAENEGRVTVTSAHDLPEGQRDAVRMALGTLTGTGVACEFACNPALICGMRVGVGPWVLRATVRDELEFFAEASRGAGVD